MTTQELGAYLKARRIAMGISIYRIMKDSGLSQKTTYRIERGNAAYAITSLLLYCDVLGLDIDFVEKNYKQEQEVQS